MKDKQFDNLFKDKLQSYSSPVPTDMWERIAQDKRKKKPVAFWFTNTAYGLYTILAISILVGGTFAWNHSNNAIAKNITSKTTSDNSNPKSNSVNKTISNTAGNARIQSNENEPSSKVNNSLTTENIKDNNTENNDNHNEGTSENKVARNDDKAVSIINKNRSSVNNNKHHISDQFKLIGTKISSTAKLDANNQNSILSSSNNINEEVKYVEKNETRSLGEMSLVKSDKVKLALGKLNATLKRTNHFECPRDKHPLNKSWYVEVYGSPEFNFKTITNTGTSSNYLKKKDSAETRLMGFNFGVRLMKNIFSNVYLKTGLQYTQYNEQFSVQRENEHQTTIVVTNKTFTLPSGDTTISDTSVFTQVGYKYTKTINQYRNIEIPIILSWRSEKIDDQWSWSVSGGLILNAYSWNNGSTIDTALGVVSISSKSSGAYSSAFGVSVMAAASIERKLNDNWAIFTEPYFRYGLSNNITSKFGFQQKFNSVGLSLGIRYKFGNRQQY